MPSAQGRHRFDLILFDLDGTLIDTAPEIGDALNTYLRARGLPEAGPDEVRGWIGHGAHELLRQAHAGRGGGSTPPSAAELREFGDIYAAHSGRNSRVYPHGRDVLDALRVAGMRLALVTNKEARFTEPLLRRLGLCECFDLVVCGDTLSARKPDPLIARHCMAALRADAARTLMVGDSAIDIATARAARVAIWTVAWGYDKSVASGRPDRMIMDLREVTAGVLRA